MEGEVAETQALSKHRIAMWLRRQLSDGSRKNHELASLSQPIRRHILESPTFKNTAQAPP